VLSFSFQLGVGGGVFRGVVECRLGIFTTEGMDWCGLGVTMGMKSPMRRLRDEDSPEVQRPVPLDLAGIHSDQLFSESDTAEGGYSPSIAGREVTTSVTQYSWVYTIHQ
jgi:hypothetical protein